MAAASRGKPLQCLLTYLAWSGSSGPRRAGGRGSPRAEVAVLTVGIPVVGVGDAAEALLPGCVPDLEGRREQRDQT